jgi:histidine triad (HIT) family protein
MMSQPVKKNCLFCMMSAHELDYVAVLEDKDLMVIMDLYPATPGHVLVLPRQHVEAIYEMPLDVGDRIMRTAIRVAKAIRERLSPVGLNLVQANGSVAGQTISHFHLHIIPGYENDQVALRFGHGNTPGSITELECTAFALMSALDQ